MLEELNHIKNNTYKQEFWGFHNETTNKTLDTLGNMAKTL